MSVIGSNVLAGASGSAVAGYEITRSLRFDSSSSSYLNRTPSSAGNRKTFTFSTWVKRAGLTAWSHIYTQGPNPGSWDTIRFDSTNDKLYVSFNANAAVLQTDAQFRDVSAWYHIVVAVDTTQSTSANRVKIYVNGAEQSVTGSYPNQNQELSINNTTQARIGLPTWNTTENLNGYLADVHFIDGQALAPTDFGEYDDNNVWQPKEYAGTYNPQVDNSQDWSSSPYNSGNTSDASYPATNAFNGSIGTTYTDGWLPANGNTNTWTSDGNFSSATSVQIYYIATGTGALTVNGSAVTTTNDSTVRSVTVDVTGTGFSGFTNSWVSSPNGPMAVLAVEVDGVRLVDTTVSSATSNSFNLDFSDNSSDAALGTDTSGNDNDWTVNNLSVASGAGNDSLIDTPTDYEASPNNGGNYCTWNPLNKASGVTLANGNLDMSQTLTGIVTGSIAVSSGKWYWEITKTDTNNHVFGVALSSVAAYSSYLGAVSGTAAFNNVTGLGLIQTPFTAATGSGIGAVSNGSVVGIALDCDNGTCKFYVDGTLRTADHITFTPGISITPAIGTNVVTGAYPANFGQRPFSQTVPTGYSSLCTTNLPNPTIADGSTAMDVVTYAGNGSTQAISGLNFSPDLVWIKSRSSAFWHELFDEVRGVSRRLFSNDTSAESFNSGQGLTSFDSDGFSLTYVDAADNGNNLTGATYAAWTWDGGTSTVSNTDGSITASVRANPSAGFSIVSWTGTANAETIGHGLNAAPEFIIAKNRDAADAWYCYHSALGNGARIQLNETSAQTTGSSQWNSTSPTSSVFSVGAGSWQAIGEDLITYCFAPVEGYSAFGSYEGGSAPFVFTGFRPRWVMIKNADLAGEEWTIFDTARDTYNVAGLVLYPNTSGAEFDGSSGVNARNIDVLSNGFKVNTGNPINQTGTHVYAAFAEHPFKYSRAR